MGHGRKTSRVQDDLGNGEKTRVRKAQMAPSRGLRCVSQLTVPSIQGTSFMRQRGWETHSGVPSLPSLAEGGWNGAFTEEGETNHEEPGPVEILLKG